MTTSKPPSGVDARAAVRARRRPVITGWLPCEAQWWAEIAAALEASAQPWPEPAVRMDLRWWDDVSRMTGADVRPGRPSLCRRWRWADWAARAVMADRAAWADPTKPDVRPSLQRPSSAPPAGLQLSPAGLQLSHSEHRGDDGAPPAGLQLSPAGLQPPSSSPPHVRRTQHTDTVTATAIEAHTSASPPESAEKRRPSAAERAAAEAEDLLRRLDSLRLQRHPSGRPLKAETWLPKLRAALKRQSAQELVDGWTWVLRSPEAAWHRGEARGGTDRTKDLALVLAHPEYAARRTWRGLEAAHELDIEPQEAQALGAPVQPLTPYQLAVAERERREAIENEELRRKFAAAAPDDDDIPF